MVEINSARREVLMAAGAMAAMGVAGQASAQEPPAPPQTPQNHRSAGPITPGRDATLTGKTAFVTGAARGIGRAIAVELAANGADVAIFDIAGPVAKASSAKPATPDDLAETKRRIEALGRKCIAIKGDMRDPASLRAAAAQIDRAWGKTDIVVANAAIQFWKSFLEQQDSDFTDVLDNNVHGTFYTLRAFAPGMVQRKYGRIIVVSSLQGKHGTAGAAGYSASKWAIIGLMKSAAMELGKYGITVNAILPGLIDTALTRYPERWSHVLGETMDNPPKNPSEQQTWDNRAPRVPLKVAWLQPEDVSPMAVFLASDAAAMATGAEFEVTGGDSAQNV